VTGLVRDIPANLSAMKAAALVALVLITACATATPAERIHERQELMRSNKAALIDLGKMASGEAPWNAEAARRLAQRIADNAAMIPAMVEKGTGQESGRTRARPEIWTDPGNFERAAWNVEDLARSIVTLARAGEEAGVRARVTRLEKDCDACHSRFMFPEFPR
jgi:cytochrome c556